MEGTATHEFFRSLAGAFAENGPRGPGVVAALVLAGIVGGVVLAGCVRRLRARRTALATFLARHDLGAEDLVLVRALAREVGAGPLDVLAHLDLFERSTQRALAAAPPGGPRDPAARIGRLRQAVGFDRLPAHAPLLSTRELAPGTAVRLEGRGAARGAVLAVDERALRVELDGALELADGAEVSLGIVHAREAQYAVRGRVLWVRPAPLDTTHVALTHDEAPHRIQRREHVRVVGDGTATLRPLRWPGVAPARPPGPGPRRPVVARLLDVSAGGLRVAAAEPLPVGLLVEAAFALGGERFEALPAVILSAATDEDGVRELHLELSGAPDAVRGRLAAAIVRAETRGRAAPPPGRSLPT
jgi:hypothetical protein